tara:strand:+ start:1516 stop:1875 length:360 start_codon:yes stop_codon:yes gene_type:complete
MVQDIIYGYSKDELSNDKIEKIKEGFKEEKKYQKHFLLFIGGLYIAFIILIISTVFDLLHFLLDYYLKTNLGNFLAVKLFVLLVIFGFISIKYKNLIFLSERPLIFMKKSALEKRFNHK